MLILVQFFLLTPETPNLLDMLLFELQDGLSMHLRRCRPLVCQ